MTAEQITAAENFSKGEFDKAFPFLAENAVWCVAGESMTEGKPDVMKKCSEVSAYFKSVATDFTTTRITCADKYIFIEGTAEFSRDGKTIAIVTACDVYKFNEENEIIEITSYCAQSKI